MSTFVVTGASRGLGYAFLQELSKNPDNIVYGLVRNKEATDQKVKAEGMKNVTIFAADITDRAALKRAADEIAKAGHVVDYLVNNAALISVKLGERAMSDITDDPQLLEDELMNNFRVNVVGVVDTINVFLPLIQKSKIKKVLTISTGLADDSLTNKYSLYEAGPYSVSKAALNTVVAKYNARHKKEGILFISLSPGVVDTGNEASPGEDSTMAAKFIEAYPHFTGPITPAKSVQMMMEVAERATPDNEFAGAFVSHHGTKEWI